MRDHRPGPLVDAADRVPLLADRRQPPPLNPRYLRNLRQRHQRADRVPDRPLQVRLRPVAAVEGEALARHP